jgi:hypothetical protein
MVKEDRRRGGRQVGQGRRGEKGNQGSTAALDLLDVSPGSEIPESHVGRRASRSCASSISCVLSHQRVLEKPLNLVPCRWRMTCFGGCCRRRRGPARRACDHRVAACGWAGSGAGAYRELTGEEAARAGPGDLASWPGTWRWTGPGEPANVSGCSANQGRPLVSGEHVAKHGQIGAN